MLVGLKMAEHFFELVKHRIEDICLLFLSPWMSLYDLIMKIIIDFVTCEFILFCKYYFKVIKINRSLNIQRLKILQLSKHSEPHLIWFSVSVSRSFNCIVFILMTSVYASQACKIQTINNNFSKIETYVIWNTPNFLRISKQFVNDLLRLTS